MNVRTWLTCGLAVTLLAACSGGGGSSPTANTPAANAPTKTTPVTPQKSGRVTVTFDAASLRQQSSKKRSPKFIGAGVTQVSYLFYDGNGNVVGAPATLSLSACASGGGTDCTITIPVAAGTYGGLSLSLQEAGPTTLGNGFTVNSSDPTNGSPTGTDSYLPTQQGASLATYLVNNATIYGFTVGSSPVALGVTFAPVNSTPEIIFSQTYNPNNPGTVFFVDGTSTPQNADINVNELDPAGNVISTAGGPVVNYTTLTSSGTGTTGGITFTPTTVSAAPATTTGTQIAVGYVGTTPPSASFETVTVTDSGTANVSTLIPFVSISNAVNSNVVSVTEGNAYYVGDGNYNPNLDSLTSSTTCTSAQYLIQDDNTPPQTLSSATPISSVFEGNPGGGSGNPLSTGSPNGTVNYTVTAPGSDTGGACTMTFTSALHPALATTFAVNSVSISSQSVIRKKSR